MTIEEMDLSVRAYNCLSNANITTIEKLTNMRVKDLNNIRNLGEKTKKEVIQKVEELGYSFNE